MKSITYFMTERTRLAASLAVLWLGTATAQEPGPGTCTGDDAIEGVNWAIADDGNDRVYVAGTGGVYRSCDGGETWTKPDSSRESPLSLLIDPLDPSIIYYGTSDGGVYRGTDYGASFSPTGAGTISGYVFSLAAKADGTILAGADSGIYRSNDHGESWERLADSPSGASIRSLLVDPDNNNIMYVGTNGNGAFRTLDGGVNWESTGTFSQVSRLEFDPLNSAIIFAAAWDAAWLSVDAGTTWSSLGGLRNSDLVVDPANASTVYRVSRLDGAHKSVDSGQTWSTVNTGLGGVLNDMYSVHVLPSGRVLVGTEFGGVYKSDDGGASWSLSGAVAAEGAEPSGGGGASVSNQAQLSVELKFRGDHNNVKAGKNGKFRVTIRNNGPDTSSSSTVRFAWFRSGLFGSTGSGYTLSTSQGSCTRPSSEASDCNLGNIPSGASVVIDFSGATQKDKGGTYYLRAWADNVESGSSAYTETSIQAKVDLTCVLIFCSTSSGGGATGWPTLLFLSVIAFYRRRLPPE